MAAQVLDDLEDEDIGFGLVDEKKDVAVAKKLGELSSHWQKPFRFEGRHYLSMMCTPEALLSAKHQVESYLNIFLIAPSGVLSFHSTNYYILTDMQT